METAPLQWNASLYQGNSTLQYELGLKAIEMLNPQPGEAIIDLGCGNGLLTIELARRMPNGRVIGIEASREMIDLARENVARSGISNISLTNMDALNIDFHEEFDALYSNSAIHWILDLKEMYRLIFGSLKPGGRIMVQTSLKEPNRLYETIFAVLQAKRYRPYFNEITWPWKFLTREENIEILTAAGFTGIEVQRYEHNFRFASIDELSGYLESAPMVPFTSQLPEEEHRGFKELFVAIYLEKNNAKAEAFSARAFISARKP